MNNKWMIKLGTPILALTLMSACGTPNNNNDDVPQDNNAPAEDTNYNDKHDNNNDMDVPDNDVNENRDKDTGIDSNKGDTNIDDNEVNENQDSNKR